MTKLRKSELIEIGHVVVVANTPVSLLKGLRKSAVVGKFLHEWSVDELRPYYDQLTARPKQNEITVALSYALLIAMILRGRFDADFSRLHWGEYLREYLSRSTAATNVLSINVPTPLPTIQSSSSAGNSILFGPDGRPIDWAERLQN